MKLFVCFLSKLAAKNHIFWKIWDLYQIGKFSLYKIFKTFGLIRMKFEKSGRIHKDKKMQIKNLIFKALNIELGFIYGPYTVMPNIWLQTCWMFSTLVTREKISGHEIFRQYLTETVESDIFIKPTT